MVKKKSFQVCAPSDLKLTLHQNNVCMRLILKRLSQFGCHVMRNGRQAGPFRHATKESSLPYPPLFFSFRSSNLSGHFHPRKNWDAPIFSLSQIFLLLRTALKVPQQSKSPMVSSVLFPLLSGLPAIFQLFLGVVTSFPHSGHLGIKFPLSTFI